MYSLVEFAEQHIYMYFNLKEQFLKKSTNYNDIKFKSLYRNC